MSPVISSDSLWNMIHDGALLEGYDEVGAVGLADKVKLSLSEHEKGTLEMRRQADRKIRRQRRSHLWWKVSRWVYALLAVVVVATVVVTIALGYDRSNDNDYAGLGPPDARWYASQAVIAYYAPHDMDALSVTKDRYLAQDAWRFEFDGPNGPVCAYVMRYEEAKVVEGSGC